MYSPPACPACLQIAGHVISEDGKKKVALKGKWNSFLDMTRCDEEGEPLAGAETVRLWEVSACWGSSAAHARLLNSTGRRGRPPVGAKGPCVLGRWVLACAWLLEPLVGGRNGLAKAADVCLCRRQSVTCATSKHEACLGESTAIKSLSFQH